MFELTIKNARVEKRGIVDIGISDGKIRYIGKIKGNGIDAKGKLVLPGFVNSHTHLDKSNLMDKMKPSQFGASLERNREFLKELKKSYSKEEIKQRARKTIEKMSKQGITAIRTQVDVDPTAGLVPLKAINELKKEFSRIVDIQICAFPQEGVIKDGARELLEKSLESGADLVGGLPLVEDKSKQKKHIDILFDIAKKYGKDLEIQIDESNDPNDFMLPYLVEGVLKEKFIGRVSATHCISLSAVKDKIADSIIKKIKKARMNVIITPSANLITRFPDVARRPYNSITRVRELIGAGVNVSVGTDNIRDIFYPFGSCSMITEAYVLAIATRMTGVNDADKLFDMATINGAKIMGLDYGVSVGKKADLIVVNAQSKREILNNLPIVPYVIKNGKIISKVIE